MVRDHYATLGFSVMESGEGGSIASLDLSAFHPAPTFIDVKGG